MKSSSARRVDPSALASSQQANRRSRPGVGERLGDDEHHQHEEEHRADEVGERRAERRHPQDRLQHDGKQCRDGDRHRFGDPQHQRHGEERAGALAERRQAGRGGHGQQHGTDGHGGEDCERGGRHDRCGPAAATGGRRAAKRAPRAFECAHTSRARHDVSMQRRNRREASATIGEWRPSAPGEISPADPRASARRRARLSRHGAAPSETAAHHHPADAHRADRAGLRPRRDRRRSTTT